MVYCQWHHTLYCHTNSEKHSQCYSNPDFSCSWGRNLTISNRYVIFDKVQLFWGSHENLKKSLTLFWGIVSKDRDPINFRYCKRPQNLKQDTFFDSNRSKNNFAKDSKVNFDIFYFFLPNYLIIFCFPSFIGVVADWVRPAITPFHPTIDSLMVRHLKNFCSKIFFAMFKKILELFFFLFQVHDRTPEYYDIEFRCLQYALFGCCFFQAAGSFAFLVMSWYVF